MRLAWRDVTWTLNSNILLPLIWWLWFFPQVLFWRPGQGYPSSDSHDPRTCLQPGLSEPWRYGGEEVGGFALEATTGGHHLRNDTHSITCSWRRTGQGMEIKWGLFRHRINYRSLTYSRPTRDGARLPWIQPSQLRRPPTPAITSLLWPLNSSHKSGANKL